MYYGEIKPYGHGGVIWLSYLGTPEEAFAEYKRHKHADILIIGHIGLGNLVCFIFLRFLHLLTIFDMVYSKNLVWLK
jgi:hypothetical protein